MTQDTMIKMVTSAEADDELAALGAMLEFVRARVTPIDPFAAYLVGMAADYVAEIEQLRPNARMRN